MAFPGSRVFDKLRVSIESQWVVTCHVDGCGATTIRPTMQDAQRAAIAHRRKHMMGAKATGGEGQ